MIHHAIAAIRAARVKRNGAKPRSPPLARAKRNVLWGTQTMSFGAATLDGAFATFGGQTMPMCNYHSPLAKKFIYKEINKIYTPYRRHIFRMKVRTAAEIRFYELTKKFMAKKLTGGYALYGIQLTQNFDFEHSGWCIPKDQYEVKKLTSFMTSKKMSDDYKFAINDIWTKVEFICHSTNMVGKCESIQMQNARVATDEEFMAHTWYIIAVTVAGAFVVTSFYWWWKYGQQPQYVELK